MTYLFNANTIVTNEVEIKNDIGNAIPVSGNIGVLNGSSLVTLLNPFPVTLGSETITIVGNTHIIDAVSILSDAEHPVFNHISAVGTSGNLQVPWLPIDGNVSIRGNVNVNPVSATITSMPPVTGNISILSIPAVTGNVGIVGNLDGITNNVNVNLGSTAITSMPPITGNVNVLTIPPVTGNVGIVGNITVNPVTATITGGNVSISGTANVVVTGVLADYEFSIAQGLVPGAVASHRSSINPSVDSGAETSIWVEGGIYPFSSWISAAQLYVLSDSTADAGQTIIIEGLDANYNLQTDTIVTTGSLTIPAITTKSFLRLHTATIVSGTTNVGEVRFRVGSTTGIVVGHIAAGFNVTKLSQYTVPAGKTAYILGGDATAYHGGAGNIAASIRVYIRPLNGLFYLVHVGDALNGEYSFHYRVPMTIPQKTDFDVRALVDTNNTRVSANYDLVLIDNPV